MDKCQGIFGKLFGQSNRTAITRGAPSSLKIGEVEKRSSEVIELINSTRPEKYPGIYCKRCGKVINGEV